MENLAKIDCECINYTWVIENYYLIMGKEGYVTTHNVNVGIDGIKFYLKFNNNPNNNRDFILYLYINGLKNDADKKKFSYKISVIKDDQIVYTRIDFPDKAAGEEIFEMDRKGMNMFISSTGSLTIHCELTYATGNLKQIFNYKSVLTNEVPKLKFDWILLDENLAIKLQTAEIIEIPAHRVVLAAASPVFKAMFSHDMLENKRQSVDMTDINYEAAVEMLRYIYTGSVKTQEFSLTTKVLAAADKYEIEGLKEECEKILMSAVSTENVIEAIMMSNKYNTNKLKIKAVDFVKRNINESPNSDKAGDMIVSMTQFLQK
ncbi:hypothetical protein TKK_0004520 [Trichogramma kaykai]|uniref:BTB domain-containing protein n=1 Tax=Trichogramma kaykai TaxID=54128 RepID=A0ABD2XNH4_9HYME